MSRKKKESCPPSRIPTDEEFARAKHLSQERYRGIEEATEGVKRRLCESTPLHDLYLFAEGDRKFRAVVFLRNKDDVAACTSSGLAERIRSCIHEELERVGRKAKDDTSLAIEFDSDDKYNGNYFLRLR